MSKSKGRYSFWKKVLIYISVLLIVGAVVDALAQIRERNLSDEEKLRRLKEDKDAYNKGVEKASTNEKWIYLTGRTIIAVGLLILNLWCYYEVVEEDLSKLLNIDEALILSYSFLAFVIAGTPTKFVNLLRNTTISIRKRWHVGKLDIDKINKDIADLELKIAQKGK